MADVRVRAVAKVLAYSDLSDEDRLISYYLWSGEQLRRSLYASEVAQELSKVDTAEPLFRSLDRIPLERDPLNRMLYLDVRHFLADHNLNYIDKTSMSAGVEARVPLLDPDLVALATKIPVDMKLRGRKTKAVFKKAMEPWVPREVVYRPKTGFGAPLRRWLKKELRETIEEVLSPSSLRNRGLFEPRAVRNLIDLDRAGKIDGSYTVFSLLCIELWCRIFKDKSGIAPAG